MNFKKYINSFIHRIQSDKIVAVCLLFHRIIPIIDDEIGPNAHCSIEPEDFETLILELSNRFYPYSLQEFITRMIEKTPLRENAFIVTFDDGYYDTWDNAYPILKKYSVPATIYITTGFINNEIVSCEHQLANWLKRQDEVHFEWERNTYHWELHTHEERQICYLAIKDLLKPNTPSRRTELLDRIIPERDIDNTYKDLFMKWDHVVELNHSPLITIGAHTHSHPVLTSLSRKEIVAEIESCKKILEKKLGTSINHFSYPYGAAHEEIKHFLRMSGFLSGVTTMPRGISLHGLDVMAIPRIEIGRQKLVGSITLPELIERCGYS